MTLPPEPEPDAPEIEAAASAPAPAPGFLTESLSFSGSGSEYFRIWIVNLALTVITLGIFSAWAKVRRLQYFYRHTRLAGAGFDYHGNPIAILKGRIVGLVLFALYSSAGYFNPWIALTIFVGLAVLMPWLLWRSLRFKFHNSSYRGIRFRFHGTAGQSYWVFLALPILTVLSLFTLGPFWHHRLKRYQFSNAAFGRSRFSMTTGVGEFYITYIFAIFIFFCMLVLLFAAMAVGAMALAITGQAPQEGQFSPGMVILFTIAGFVYSITLVAMQAITTARIQNACWNEARTDHHRFESRMSAPRLFGVLYTNFLGTIFTLGLYRPFAQVRLAAYVASTLTVLGNADFDAYAAGEGDDVTAVGEETTDMFDFDIAF